MGTVLCPHGSSYLPKIAISAPDLEVLDILLVSATRSGIFQRHWSELLTLLEYVNLGLLAKEEGSEY